MKRDNLGRRGQSLAEYGLVLALISVASIGGLQLLGGTLSTQFTQLAHTFGNLPTGPGKLAIAIPPQPNTTTPIPGPSIPTASPSPTPAATAPNTPSATPGPSINPPYPIIPTSTKINTTTGDTPAPNMSNAIANPNCSGTTAGCGMNTNDSSNW